MEKTRFNKIRNYNSSQFNKFYEKAVQEFLRAELKCGVITIYYLPGSNKKAKPTLQLEFNTIPEVSQEMSDTQELLSYISFVEYCELVENNNNKIIENLNFITLFDLVENDSDDGIGKSFYYQSALASDYFYENLEGREKWLVEVMNRIKNGEVLAEIFLKEEKRLAANRAADRLLRVK